VLGSGLSLFVYPVFVSEPCRLCAFRQHRSRCPFGAAARAATLIFQGCTPWMPPPVALSATPCGAGLQRMTLRSSSGPAARLSALAHPVSRLRNDPWTDHFLACGCGWTPHRQTGWASAAPRLLPQAGAVRPPQPPPARWGGPKPSRMRFAHGPWTGPPLRGAWQGFGGRLPPRAVGPIDRGKPGAMGTPLRPIFARVAGSTHVLRRGPQPGRRCRPGKRDPLCGS
jgi:hypothetical protein